MSYVFALALPGLTLLLLQHVCKAGNERSGLLNELVSNIDRGTVRSLFVGRRHNRGRIR